MYYHRRWLYEGNWVCLHSKMMSKPLNKIVDRRAAALLYAHEGNETSTTSLSLLCKLMHILYSGAEHLYLLDFSPENLPNLKSTIEKSYPDVKVSSALLYHELGINH